MVHPLALCESRNLGPRTRVWAFAHVLPGARVGSDCNICDHVFVENDVVVGDRVTIKSGVQLWDGMRVEDDVFIGPNATFTNDRFPRSRRRPDKFATTVIEAGASIGANATILPGITIGAGAMVGAGAVVVQPVPPRAIVVGNPARILGYVDAGTSGAPGERPPSEGERRAPEADAAVVATDRKPLVIVGTGEWGLLADQYFTHDSDYDVVAFATERAHLPGPEFAGRPAVALEDLADRYPPATHHAFVAASGTRVNALRARLYAEVKRQGFRCATYVSSRALVWPNAVLGENCLVAEFTSIHPFATVGNDVFLHTGNVVGHRAVVDDHCFVSTHVVVAGYCHVGAHTFLGLNVTLNDRTAVPERCIVTSGSVVANRLTLPDRVYHGSPAMAIDGLSSQDVQL
jgi:sugar O-acyltransferase (sialic acid O-acetyltransferase NeuD family)